MASKIKNLPNTPGRVVEEQKNFFLVDTNGGIIRCTIKGVLKKSKIRICTGDLVTVEIINEDLKQGLITTTNNRINHLPRPPLANIEKLFFISSYTMPPIDLESIDRFLFSTAVYGINSALVFNKVDILNKDETEKLDAVCDSYQKAGYETYYTSAKSKYGIDELIQSCEGKLCAFAGLSGVGKSSLLSVLIPDQTFKTGDLSQKNGKGTHTTTHTSLVPFTENGYIADTPGLSLIDIPRIDEEDTSIYFPELESRVGTCKFNDCIHLNEPGCEILDLVKKGTIAPWRHHHYLKIRQEMETMRKRYR